MFAGKLRFRSRLLHGLTPRLFLFRKCGVAFLHEHLQAIPVALDLLFQPLDGLRVEDRSLVGRGSIRGKPDFEFRCTQARLLQIGVDRAIVGVERIHLCLEILHRLADVGVALLHAGLELLPHLGLCGLHVGGGFHLSLVGGREEFLGLRTGLLLARQFQRRFLLRMLEGLDAPVQLIHETVGFPFRASALGRGCWCGIPSAFKFRNLTLKSANFILLRTEFLPRLIPFLGGAFGKFLAHGCGRLTERHPVRCTFEIPAQILSLRGGMVPRIGERLALLFQVRELSLVIAANRGDTTLHVSGQIVDLECILHRRRRPGHGRGGGRTGRQAQRRIRRPGRCRWGCFTDRFLESALHWFLRRPVAASAGEP